MSLDEPIANKMMQAAPAKKGFHFASDGLHFAEYILADNIEAATSTYHKVKRLISPPVSTVTPKLEEKADVQ